MTADGLSVDESNLTGEPEPALRGMGNPVWSGSFVVEGAAVYEATAAKSTSGRGQASGAAADTAAARVQVLSAGIVNLVPEGLILLISVAAAVSAFKVSQRGVLAQQLNAIESLASVDVVCTDKTGR